jgi:hypothetical protein
MTGVELSVGWLSEVMKARGHVFRRPKHELTHAGPSGEKSGQKTARGVQKKVFQE